MLEVPEYLLSICSGPNKVHRMWLHCILPHHFFWCQCLGHFGRGKPPTRPLCALPMLLLSKFAQLRKHQDLSGHSGPAIVCKLFWELL